jgi:addiction module RelB/DinJ family antitoxin
MKGATMADAMVTARMGASKKAAASEVLDSLGLSASSAVNSLFDYLIANGKMPDLSGASRILLINLLTHSIALSASSSTDSPADCAV